MFDKEQIIKAWECCGSTTYRCDECPIEQQKKDDCICGGYLAQCTLALYRELTIELDAMRGTANALKMHLENAEAETVRRMQERLKEQMQNLARNEYGGVYYFLVSGAFIDRIAKEILEETK